MIVQSIITCRQKKIKILEETNFVKIWQSDNLRQRRTANMPLWLSYGSNVLLNQEKSAPVAWRQQGQV
jgi:hypothetical protein